MGSEEDETWLPVKAACRAVGVPEAFPRVHAAIRAGRIEPREGPAGQRLVRAGDVRAVVGRSRGASRPVPSPVAAPVYTHPSGSVGAPSSGHPGLVALREEIERRRLTVALEEMAEHEAARRETREQTLRAAEARAEERRRERDEAEAADQRIELERFVCDLAFKLAVDRIGVTDALRVREALAPLARVAAHSERGERAGALREAVAKVCDPVLAERARAALEALRASRDAREAEENARTMRLMLLMWAMQRAGG